MFARPSKLPGVQLDAAEKVMRAAVHLWTQEPESASQIQARVFVTVSRQPGAGGKSFSHQLAARLNQEGLADWSAWDQELVEHVAQKHGIPKDLIEMLPDRHRSWLSDLAESFSSHARAPEFAEIRAYKRVAVAIRALAEQGHAIIVGQGGSLVTERMSGGIHLRLIASLEHRIRHTADREQIGLVEAAQRVAEIDRRRGDFYRRFWPGRVISPEQFTMTLNSGEMSVEEMVEAVVPVVGLREAALAKPKESIPRPTGSGGMERTACHASSDCL